MRAIKSFIATAIASIYTMVVDLTEALNQARAQSGRFSGAHW